MVRKKTLCENPSSLLRNFDFIPSCANKFFVATCDSGLLICDFETNQILQTVPRLYGFLCGDVCFTNCSDIKVKQNEYLLLTKGQIHQDSNQALCHLHALNIPSKGTGEFKLKEKNQFAHAQYKIHPLF